MSNRLRTMRPGRIGGLFGKAAAALAIAVTATAAEPVPSAPSWTRPTAPFHVVGPIWYVGTEGLASYLIKTRAGAILIDGTMAENAPHILASIRRVGVEPRDVKLLLVSHAHFDHVAADAALIRATGARLAAGAADRAALERGVPASDVDYGVVRFPPVHVDRAIRDGEVVRLGEVALVAHATPGHTPGCTSWSTQVRDGGRTLAVLFPCSVTVAGNKLVGNRGYPGIVADFRTSFARLGTMRADVVLPFHPEITGLMDQEKRAAAGDRNAFVDPAALPRIVTGGRADFDRELARQRR